MIKTEYVDKDNPYVIIVEKGYFKPTMNVSSIEVYNGNIDDFKYKQIPSTYVEQSKQNFSLAEHEKLYTDLLSNKYIRIYIKEIKIKY